MANKLYEETNIQAIANAIRGKNGSSDTYTVAQMAQAITDIPSGGSITVDNGRIEQIKSSSGTLTPNKFVQNDKMFFATNFKGNSGKVVQLLKLSDNKVLAVCLYSSKVRYTIVNIDNVNDTMTFSTTQSINVSLNYTSIKAFLESDKVYLFMISNNYGIGAAIFSLSGETLTLDKEEIIITDSTIGYSNYFDAAKADNGRYLLLYSSTSNKELYGSVVEISGNNFSVGAQTQICSVAWSASHFKVCSLDTNKILVRYTDSSNRAIVNILTISGTTISLGTEVQIDTATYVYYFCFSKISSSKVLVLYTTSSYIKRRILDISGSSITVGNSSNLFGSFSSQEDYYATDFENGKAALVYPYSEGMFRIGVAFLSESNGNVSLIKKQAVTNIDGTYSDPKIIFYNNGAVLIQSYYSKKTPFEIFVNTWLDSNNNIVQTQRISQATSSIDGLLVSEATTSTAGNVYILDV